MSRAVDGSFKGYFVAGLRLGLRSWQGLGIDTSSPSHSPGNTVYRLLAFIDIVLQITAKCDTCRFVFAGGIMRDSSRFALQGGLRG